MTERILVCGVTKDHEAGWLQAWDGQRYVYAMNANLWEITTRERVENQYSHLNSKSQRNS